MWKYAKWYINDLDDSGKIKRSVSILGDFYRHEPIKEKIRKTLKTINNEVLANKSMTVLWLKKKDFGIIV